jgi:hypothetical protein
MRKLFIYAYTSLYPTQRINLPLWREQQVQMLCREILMLTRPRWGASRPIAACNLAALFICGTAVTTAEEKTEVLSNLESMSVDATGREFRFAINALKVLYEEQKRVRGEGRDEREVDWVIFLKMKGMLDFSCFGI